MEFLVLLLVFDVHQGHIVSINSLYDIYIIKEHIF